MSAQIDAPKYTYLKRGVYYFVSLMILTSLNAHSANWNKKKQADEPKESIQSSIGDTRTHSKGAMRNMKVTTYAPSFTPERDDSLRLWNPSPDRTSCLRAISTTTKISGFDKSAAGYRWPNLENNAAAFNTENLKLLNVITWHGQEPPKTERQEQLLKSSVDVLRSRLLNAAKEKAFTKVKWDNRGASPAFSVAVTVKATSFAVAGLKSINALTADDLSTIDSWVLSMIKQMAKTKCSSGCDLSADSVVAVYAANILYGAASQNRTLFELGAQEFKEYLQERKNLKLGEGVRNSNEVMHHALIAAAVLELNGIPARKFPVGNKTLSNAVELHAQDVIEEGEKPLKTAGDLKDEARIIMKKEGYGTHIAWVPVYLSHYEAGSEPEIIKKLDKKLRDSEGMYQKAYFGLQVGIHSGCYFGMPK
jgi:hypothetical protein